MATQPILKNIKGLTITTTVQPGVFFLVETDQGTLLLDYKDLIISEDNITFAPLLSALDTDLTTLSAQTEADLILLASELLSLSAQVIGISTGSIQDQLDTLTSQVSNLQSSLVDLQIQSDASTSGLITLSAVVARVQAQAQSVYTTVNINSAGHGWTN